MPRSENSHAVSVPRAHATRPGRMILPSISAADPRRRSRSRKTDNKPEIEEGRVDGEADVLQQRVESGDPPIGAGFRPRVKRLEVARGLNIMKELAIQSLDRQHAWHAKWLADYARNQATSAPKPHQE